MPGPPNLCDMSIEELRHLIAEAKHLLELRRFELSLHRDAEDFRRSYGQVIRG